MITKMFDVDNDDFEQGRFEIDVYDLESKAFIQYLDDMTADDLRVLYKAIGEHLQKIE